MDILMPFFFPGGHGPLWDLAVRNRDSTRLIEGLRTKSDKKPVSGRFAMRRLFQLPKALTAIRLYRAMTVTVLYELPRRKRGLTEFRAFSWRS